MMIQFRLKELIAEKERLTGERYPYRRIAEITHVSPTTLSAMANNSMKQVGVSTIDKLCELLDCEPGDLMVRVR